jgi:hypothetical protein
VAAFFVCWPLVLAVLQMMGREDPALLPRGFEGYTSPSKSSRPEAEEAKARGACRGLG